MPSTRPQPTQKPTKESIRTAIVVGLIIGLLGIIVLTSLLYQRGLRRSTKADTFIGRSEIGRGKSEQCARRRSDVEKGFEVGVIQEPLPVYTKEIERGEMGLESWVVR
jgi:hypothetical protein